MPSDANPLAAHAHYFRKVDGQWVCAGCGAHVSTMAPHDTRCTFASPCAECAADYALLGNHPDPYATIARRP